MTIGLLPALGSGIRELAATGQASRLVDGYLVPYVRAFGDLAYFSYLPESLAEFTADPELLAHVRMLAPPAAVRRGRRAVGMTRMHAEEFRRCRALRVFQVTGVIPAIMARARFGTPYVTTYGFWYARLSRPGPGRLLKAVVERVGLRRAAAVIVPTEELRAYAARRARHVWLVPNGVDTDRFVPRAEARPAGAVRRILYVGRLSPEKNLSSLVRAAGMLKGRVPLVLTFAGSGPLQAPLADEAARAGVPVEWLGVVDHRQLPSVYASADAFVLASFTEGHPKVLLEAMSAGLACVASDCPGNRSLVVDGKHGLLFDPYRADELAARLEAVLTDADLAAGLGAAARDFVLARYDLRALVSREIELLGALAAS
jgi:glycosyltransferase involved in cell wall biosynthesis